MEELNKKKITASEARQIAETTHSFINRIYKAIREESKEGKTFLMFDCEWISKNLLDNAVTELQANGFSIEFIDYEHNYSSDHNHSDIIIKW